MFSLIPSRNYRSKAVRQQHAFTLLELLVVAVIIVLISTVAMTAFTQFSRSQQLDAGLRTVENTVKEAQSRALSSVGGLNWGVRVVPSSIVTPSRTIELFSNDGFDHVTPVESTIRDLGSNVQMGSPITFPWLDIGTPLNVIFSPVNGSMVAVRDNGTCIARSADSTVPACSGVTRRCVGIRIRISGTTQDRYVKINERDIFIGDPTIACP